MSDALSETLDEIDWRPPRRAGWWLPWGVRWLARLATVFFSVVGYLPVGGWVFWQCQAIRARVHRNRWPRYDDLDRWNASREYLEVVPWIDAPMAVLTILLAGGYTWYRLGRPPTDKTESAPRAVAVALRMVAVAGAVFCLGIAMLYFDPFDLRHLLFD